MLPTGQLPPAVLAHRHSRCLASQCQLSAIRMLEAGHATVGDIDTGMTLGCAHPMGPRGISAFVVEKSDPGVSFGEPEKKLGIKGSPTRSVILANARIPADRIIGAGGTGFTTALATLDHTRITIAAQAVGIAQGRWTTPPGT